MRRQHRWAMTGGAVLLAVALTTACSPDPTPTPTPTGFASEEEAFAAAEATYRAYVDALNEVDFRDPETFEPALAWTSGSANAADKKDFAQSHADGITLSGEFAVAGFRATEWDREASQVLADGCLDVSQTEILDADGKSTAIDGRMPVVPVSLTFVSGSTATELKLDNVVGRDGGLAC